ncbi:vanillate O-demethylase ferredoxin subunit [Sphaerotilus hippei]|uniref:Vanillate O-demethylase ferredoxin subunit n=1 Tax=Sphaerotilus hippei TaxID=744406 RepID=A0A318H620_9BURK|nr:PDR/VanB family oxidoreductase [Sphaerotilus hippei]PXW99365.1 vanillate O-demethylase ferredoxin subunit [Sphaerotilus hippei]
MSTELLDVVVRQPTLQGQSVAIFHLEDASGRPLPAFSAGAHVDLHLPGGLVRPYSLCSDPADTHHYRLGVLKDPASRGGSVAVHQHLLSEGTRLAISAPRNHFPLDESAPHSVLAGGGIGITPMLAMAARLHATGASFELHYCVRSRAQAAFLDELVQAPWAARVTVHADDEAADTRLAPQALLRAAPAGSHLYVCGPSGFMDWVLAEAEAAGLPAAQRHREYFSAPIVTPAAGDQPVEIVARRSGRTVVAAADETLRSALERVGIKVQVSCEQGVCGTCACTVLEGEPEHRDAYLTDEEREANDQILVCCSRARSARLVLDI